MLRTLRSRDLYRNEWLRLQEYAAHDPFLGDAIDGLKQISPESRGARLESILRKLAASGRKKKTGAGISVWVGAAASFLLVIGSLWLIRQYVWNKSDQIPQQMAMEEELDEYSVSNTGSKNDTGISSHMHSIAELESNTIDESDSQTSHASPGSRVSEKQDKADEARSKAEKSTSQDVAKPVRPLSESPEVKSHMASEPDTRPLESGFAKTDEESQAVAKNALSEINPGVNGIVMTFVGEPLRGVQVQVKGTEVQTLTDYHGNFNLIVPYQSTHNALVITHEGYPLLETHAADGDSIVVRLQENRLAGTSDVITFTQHRKANTPQPGARSLARPLPGERSYNKYLRQNLRYPTEASNAGIHGTVVLEFDISSDGIPYKFRVVKSIGYGCDDEAIRLIREGPVWKVAGAQVSIGRWEVEF
ncbi:MAG TPA: TonB family protein [Saprospiraceae bacterium]|nr:TonB family protein [Saprospiraceae bacterium]